MVKKMLRKEATDKDLGKKIDGCYFSYLSYISQRHPPPLAEEPDETTYVLDVSRCIFHNMCGENKSPLMGTSSNTVASWYYLIPPYLARTGQISQRFCCGENKRIPNRKFLLRFCSCVCCEDSKLSLGDTAL